MKDKVIFESEEKLDEFLDACEIRDKELRKCIQYFAKFKGYIRKSPVKEAEEMYPKWKMENCVDILHNKQHEAIQQLKAENERLKK